MIVQYLSHAQKRGLELMGQKKQMQNDDDTVSGQ